MRASSVPSLASTRVGVGGRIFDSASSRGSDFATEANSPAMNPIINPAPRKMRMVSARLTRKNHARRRYAALLLECLLMSVLPWSGPSWRARRHYPTPFPLFLHVGQGERVGVSVIPIGL